MIYDTASRSNANSASQLSIPASNSSTVATSLPPSPPPPSPPLAPPLQPLQQTTTESTFQTTTTYLGFRQRTTSETRTLMCTTVALLTQRTVLMQKTLMKVLILMEHPPRLPLPRLRPQRLRPRTQRLRPYLRPHSAGSRLLAAHTWGSTQPTALLSRCRVVGAASARGVDLYMQKAIPDHCCYIA